MFESSQVLNTLMPVITAFLPAIGAVLLVRSQSQRRKPETTEIIACFCILVGFLLFITLEGYWLAAAVAGGFVAVIGIWSLIRRSMRRKEVIVELDKPDRRIQNLLVEIEKMDLVHVFGQSFEDQDIYLDGREFVDCNFKHCRFFVRVGHWRISGKFHLEGCGFDFKYPSSVVRDTLVTLNSQ